MKTTPMRTARKRLALSLEELANRVGSTKGHLSRVESGCGGASLDLAAKLATELGINEMQILYPERYSNGNE